MRFPRPSTSPRPVTTLLDRLPMNHTPAYNSRGRDPESAMKALQWLSPWFQALLAVCWIIAACFAWQPGAGALDRQPEVDLSADSPTFDADDSGDCEVEIYAFMKVT